MAKVTVIMEARGTTITIEEEDTQPTSTAGDVRKLPVLLAQAAGRGAGLLENEIKQTIAAGVAQLATMVDILKKE